MNRESIIREVQSMLDAGGYQVAKAIVRLAEQPEGTYKKIGYSGCRRPMSQSEAARMIAKAKARIELVDSTD